MKIEFESMALENFWSAGLEIYPKLAEKALAVLSMQSRVFFPGLLKE